MRLCGGDDEENKTEGDLSRGSECFGKQEREGWEGSGELLGGDNWAVTEARSWTRGGAERGTKGRLGPRHGWCEVNGQGQSNSHF